MFALSVLTAIYSYGIFGLGIFSILNRSTIIGLTFSWILISLFYLKDKIRIQFIKLTGIELFICSVICLQALINLLGTLGPEYGFDALWYHLSLPKIWLTEHVIRFLPGAVYKYSVMPKLTETLYTAALSLGGVLPAKIIHYLFGLAILIPLYGLGRKYLSRPYTLIVLLLYYTNLVVGWESITAYVDLARTFFEVLALKLFLDEKYTQSAITLGLAISVKLISLGSLPIFLILLFFRKKSLLFAVRYMLYVILVPLPWFLFALINTGNPLYPVFSAVYPTDGFSFSLTDIWLLFTQSQDPVSPVYIITAPLILLNRQALRGRGVSFIFLYALLSVIVWFVTPRTGGGRFILPYLPVLSVAAVILVAATKDLIIKKALIAVIILTSVSSVFYRFAANLKYIPVLVGRETQQQFLLTRLSFSFGDFYDTDGYLARTLTPGDNLLVSGINNVFYLPGGIRFTHITTLPNTFSLDDFTYILARYPSSGFRPGSDWQIIHTDSVTHTALYHKK